MSTVSVYPLVSIITINYNQAKATGDFLASVQKITYPSTEIIVIDNASPEPGFNNLKESFPNVLFIQNHVNKGFAGGNNIGVAAAKGEYLLFINNDTEVEQDFLQPLVDCMRSEASIGMVSPKIKYYFNKGLIQYAGGTRINPFTGRGKFMGSGQPDSNLYHQSYPTALIHGAAMLVSRELIRKAGLMYEPFFLYYEELDWCERAKRAGFTLYYCGKSVVYHKVSFSTGKSSALKVYYLTRNRLLFARRNYTGPQLLTSVLFFAVITVPKNTIFYILNGEYHLLKAFVKGFWWHICGNPSHQKHVPEPKKTNNTILIAE